MLLSTAKFGEAGLFTIQNNSGVEVSITNYGGIITSIKTPNRNGLLGETILGFDSLKDYQKPHPWIGPIIGRCANRIAGGRFLLDGQLVQLSQNEGQNHLHGGFKGFDKVLWNVENFYRTDRGAELVLSHLSKEEHEGYPGNLNCKVCFILSDDNSLSLRYECTSDVKTIVNLTHHDYFNLKDDGMTPVYDHQLTIFADAFTPTDKAGLTTGTIQSLEGHFADFRQACSLREKLNKYSTQLPFGFDHNYVLQKELHPESSHLLSTAAELYDPHSGRLLKLSTTQPGLQLYTAGHFPKEIIGRRDPSNGQPIIYKRGHALCLEGQHFPNTANHPHFPQSIVSPQQSYRQEYQMEFCVKP